MEYGDGTQAVWAGEAGTKWQRSTQVPIAASVSFGYHDVDEWLAVAKGEADGHIYGRNTNPTVAAFEAKVAALEHAEAATAFATGMAAISDTLHTLLDPGERVVSVRDTYGGTSKLFLDFLPRLGIRTTLCDTADHDTIEAEIAEGCNLVYLETPTNPTLKILDLERLSRAAHRVGATVVVDNTFATPINQRPLELGADLVIHSATKFLGGHADALGGVVCGDAELVERIYRYREITGAALGPFAAYLLLRSIKTLPLRVAKHNENAMAIATHLTSHPAIDGVYYPGLESHPGHEIAKSQMRGFGGVLSFSIKGGFDSVRKVLPRLRLAHRAANLGAVETVVGPPATTSHVELTAEERASLGIPENLVRYSAGIEDTADLINDLDEALAVLA
ncbi:MAG: cystathionine gamma-synthase family protein [Armatimonadetes bacterium]|nr:MAG: cystathionine gamma-synthase family protein [Armatimonadota bacterium]